MTVCADGLATVQAALKQAAVAVVKSGRERSSAEAPADYERRVAILRELRAIHSAATTLGSHNAMRPAVLDLLQLANAALAVATSVLERG